MTIRQINNLIITASVLLALACAAVLALGFALPIRIEDDPSYAPQKNTPSPNASTRPANPGPEHSQTILAELRQLTGANLRRPLFDPTPTPPVPTPQIPMTITLVGIVNEPGHSMALFRKGDSSTVLCAVGESVQDAGGPVTVVSVHNHKVTVRYAQQLRELELPPSSTPPGKTTP